MVCYILWETIEFGASWFAWDEVWTKLAGPQDCDKTVTNLKICCNVRENTVNLNHLILVRLDAIFPWVTERIWYMLKVGLLAGGKMARNRAGSPSEPLFAPTDRRLAD